jgi:hypothetical protein
MNKIKLIPLTITLLFFLVNPIFGQDKPLLPQSDLKQTSSAFDLVSNEALDSMIAQAIKLKLQGAAVVAYIDGDATKSWISKMVVVGSFRKAPTEKHRGGANSVAIAYSKAAEMAESLKNSGNSGRPVMAGETGYRGGLIAKCANGYAIAAFSGGTQDQDVLVSQAGIEVLTTKLLVKK